MQNLKYYMILLPLCLCPLANAALKPSATAVAAQLVPMPTVEQRLKDAPLANSRREATLLSMFKAAGCADLTEQPVDSGDPSNVICRMPGETPSLIIVAGHLDHVRHGDGIVDDWSGASMLPSLYQALRSGRRRHTFLFIGFNEEEKGLLGSKFYVRHLSPAFIRRIDAMVNLECLGMNPSEVWQDHADANLLAGLNRVAGTMGTRVPGVNLENIGDDDAMSFRHRKVPTITIHSLSQDTLRVLHSNRDNFSAEHMKDYYWSYELVARYLVYLDKTLP